MMLPPNAFLRLLVVSLWLTRSWSMYSVQEAHGLSDFLRGGDKRLIRERPYTASHSRTGTFCEVLDSLIDTLRHSDDLEVKYYTADALVTCLIHRPDNQNAAGMNPHFHEVVVDYLREEPHMAAELIWAATENNYINLNGFIEKNAVEELFRIMQYYENSVAAMWAAAALMNMSTSYCGNGPCIWKWNENDKLKVTHDVEVDGLVARLQIMGLDGVWDVLMDQVCSSVAFEGTHGVTFPTRAVQKTDAASVVPWAMAGLIKTLALKKTSHRWLEGTVPCLCILSYSDDALERRNAWEALYNLGRDGSCHAENPRDSVCVDMPFKTDNGKKCSDFASFEDCDKFPVDEAGTSSTEACCVCGGGDDLENIFGKATDDDL